MRKLLNEYNSRNLIWGIVIFYCFFAAKVTWSAPLDAKEAVVISDSLSHGGSDPFFAPPLVSVEPEGSVIVENNSIRLNNRDNIEIVFSDENTIGIGQKDSTEWFQVGEYIRLAFGNRWYSQNNNIEQTLRESNLEELTSVFFVDENMGWVAGRDSEWNTAILKTTNGGNSWHRIALQNIEDPSEVILDMFFLPDQSHGWTVGGNGRILHTTNQGTSWDTLSSPPPVQDTIQAQLNSVYFTSANSGWVGNFGGSLFRTQDGGENWQEHSDFIDNDLSINHIMFLSDIRYGWLVGDGGLVAQTIDGGDTWQIQNPHTFANIYSIHFLNTSDGWLVGNGGVMRKTTDGGQTWTAINPDIPPEYQDVDFRDIQFTNQNNGWTCGQYGVVLQTNDGGETWQLLSTETNNQLNDLYMVLLQVPAGHPSDVGAVGWVVGDNGTLLYKPLFKSDGRIYSSQQFSESVSERLPEGKLIRSATLTPIDTLLNENQSITYYITNQPGEDPTWIEAVPGVSVEFDQPGPTLQWSAHLDTGDPTPSNPSSIYRSASPLIDVINLEFIRDFDDWGAYTFPSADSLPFDMGEPGRFFDLSWSQSTPNNSYINLICRIYDENDDVVDSIAIYNNRQDEGVRYFTAGENNLGSKVRYTLVLHQGEEAGLRDEDAPTIYNIKIRRTWGSTGDIQFIDTSGGVTSHYNVDDSTACVRVIDEDQHGRSYLEVAVYDTSTGDAIEKLRLDHVEGMTGVFEGCFKYLADGRDAVNALQTGENHNIFAQYVDPQDENDKHTATAIIGEGEPIGPIRFVGMTINDELCYGDPVTIEMEADLSMQPFYAKLYLGPPTLTPSPVVDSIQLLMEGIINGNQARFQKIITWNVVEALNPQIGDILTVMYDSDLTNYDQATLIDCGGHGEEEKSFIVYPNPFKEGAWDDNYDAQYPTFEVSGYDDFVVKIFNIAADQVRKIDAIDFNRNHCLGIRPEYARCYVWDLTNDDGQSVSSGTYFAVLEPKSDDSVMIKLIVIR